MVPVPSAIQDVGIDQPPRSCSSNVPKITESFESKPSAKEEIPVRLTDRNIYSSYKPVALIRARNCSSWIKIPISNRNPKTKSSHAQLPCFLLCNARSLLRKVDELLATIKFMSSDVTVITETWLHEINDKDSINIPGFSLLGRDRPISRGGGVCVYVSNTVPSKRRVDLESPLYECMWIWLRPYRLPCPLSRLITAVIYNPPDKSSQEQKDFVQYLIDTVDFVINQYPDCGIAILEDFNKLDISDLILYHNLKQVVKCGTRESSVLDLIVTNLSNFYHSPVCNAPLGSSDHNVITWNPSSKESRNRNFENTSKLRKCTVKLFPDHQLMLLEDGPTSMDLPTSDLKSAIDLFFPTRTVRMHNTDKPWRTTVIK